MTKIIPTLFFSTWITRKNSQI